MEPNQVITEYVRSFHTASYKNNSKLFKTFDNKLVNQSYKIIFGDDNHTCTVADWTVTMNGAMKGADGKMIPPTEKTAELEFFIVATWKDGEIVEERLFYDVVGFMKQLVLM